MHKQLVSFVKKMMGRFVRISIIQSAEDVTEIDYKEASNQLPGNSPNMLNSN